ncbi:MAG: hypothetical protein E7384_06745, partial [Ruminococcaceae bacterium]|nr:hypothetical protein [Oscillospiraceae bacterium]
MIKNKTTINSVIWSAIAILIAYVIRVFPYDLDQTLLISAAMMVRYIIHICLLIAWSISIQRRITNRHVRHLLMAAGILMALWLTVRTVKYELIVDRTNPIGRYIWYSYYIPMVLIPLIGFFVVKYIDKPADYYHPKWMNFLAIPAGLLLALVFTNDLHQLVFRFHKGIELFDTQYKYGIPYYILMAWFILGGLYFVVMLLKKNRVPGSRKMQRLPLYIILGAIVFWVLYTLKIINCDLTVMDCLLIVCLVESAIQSGMIPSNTNHWELFNMTTVPLLIVDEDFQPHYVSGGALPVSEADIAKTQTGAVHLKNTLLRSTPISAGRVVWQDDITAQNALCQQLQDIREQMSEENTLLQAEVELTEHKAKIDEQNRLYDRIAREVAPQLIRAEELMKRVSAEPEKARELMAKICVLGCYIKRRGNLLLLGEDNKQIPAAELEHCIRESLDNLRLGGVFTLLDSHC